MLPTKSTFSPAETPLKLEIEAFFLVHQVSSLIGDKKTHIIIKQIHSSVRSKSQMIEMFTS